MALTHDENKEILELRGRGYSLRKISDKTGHSENTIRGVIAESEERATELATKGLEAEQIASQLDYPLPFVRNVIDQRNVAPGKKLDVEAEVGEVVQRVEITTAFDEFESRQKLTIAKERLTKRIQWINELLRQLDKQLKDEEIDDNDWGERKQWLEQQLADFVSPRIDSIDSQESLSSLKEIIERIHKEAGSLLGEYRTKVKEARQLRLKEEKKRSNELLKRHIDIPLFPGYVKSFIKRKFVIKTDEEALMIADAMHEIALLIIWYREENTEKEKLEWDNFVARVKEDGWEAIKIRATQYGKNP